MDTASCLDKFPFSFIATINWCSLRVRANEQRQSTRAKCVKCNKIKRQHKYTQHATSLSVIERGGGSGVRGAVSGLYSHVGACATGRRAVGRADVQGLI